ncbi:MAG: AraD1 family protein [Opitutus sp.]
MNLVQFRTSAGERRVGVVNGSRLEVLVDWTRTYDLARAAIAARKSIKEILASATFRGFEDFDQLLAGDAVFPPLDHADSAHCLVSGTGLTHLGSAQARDAMHAASAVPDGKQAVTDSMRLFRLGVQQGKPGEGETPLQPEWFYKGDGSFIVAPGQPLERPAFADDGGEEPEIVGLYVIGDDGTPSRVGFALGNEFSDHVMERKNYLYLSHSKLRQCSIGPELWVGELPAAVEGTVKIIRDGRVFWSERFLSGEANMSFHFAGLEHHHFKYRQFRRPGDVHVHFFGTSTLSITAGVQVQDGDVFEIRATPFSRPLRNAVVFTRDSEVVVHSL